MSKQQKQQQVIQTTEKVSTPHHRMSPQEIKKIADLYLQNNFQKMWSNYYRNNKSSFSHELNENKLSQFCSRTGLSRCTTEEQVKNWVSERLGENSVTNDIERDTPLSFLEKDKHMTGGNFNNLSNSIIQEDSNLSQNTILCPSLLKDVIAQSGLMLSPYNAESEDELLIGWPRYLLNGVDLSISFESDRVMLLKTRQKPMEERICHKLIKKMHKTFTKDEILKTFSVPIQTTTRITLPVQIDDQNILLFKDEDIIGVVMKKKQFGNVYSFDDIEEEEFKEEQQNKEEKRLLPEGTSTTTPMQK